MPKQDPNSSVSGYEIFYDFWVGFLLASKSIIPILINKIVFDIGSRGSHDNSLLILKDIVPDDPKLRRVDNIEADVRTIRDRILQQDGMMRICASDCDIALDVMTDIIFFNDCIAVLYH